VQPLADNYDEDEFKYLIHVHTGFKLASGTKSKVYFRVNGTEGETGERKLDDGLRQVFSHCSYTYVLLRHCKNNDFYDWIFKRFSDYKVVLIITQYYRFCLFSIVTNFLQNHQGVPRVPEGTQGCSRGGKKPPCKAEVWLLLGKI